MFPIPASDRWSSRAAFTGARRPLRRCGSARGVNASEKRLVPEALGQIRVELARLEQQPGAEAAHVAVGDVRSVV